MVKQIAIPGKTRDGEPTSAEAIIEPDLPIVDPHHHLWFVPESQLSALETAASLTARALAAVFRRKARYLFDELMSDLASGHNVRASVFVEAHAMYRAGGPKAMQSLGETEFANGVAAMAASGIFGDVKACAGIVGNVDLRMGDAVEDLLGAHIDAGGGRFRGVRGGTLSAYDADSSILNPGGVPQLLLDKTFRAGFARLQKLGLSFDVWLLEPQLPDLIDLACTFPGTAIILDHAGSPIGIGSYAGRREERFSIWSANIRALSKCPNVAIKLGGLGMPVGGFDSFMRSPPATSAQLAAQWQPYIETCIEAFGVDRCMFESNFPVDSGTCTYPVLWNAFKRLTAAASKEDKAALFGGTATKIYRLAL